MTEIAIIAFFVIGGFLAWSMCKVGGDSDDE